MGNICPLMCQNKEVEEKRTRWRKLGSLILKSIFTVRRQLSERVRKEGRQEGWKGGGRKEGMKQARKEGRASRVSLKCSERERP